MHGVMASTRARALSLPHTRHRPGCSSPFPSFCRSPVFLSHRPHTPALPSPMPSLPFTPSPVRSRVHYTIVPTVPCADESVATCEAGISIVPSLTIGAENPFEGGFLFVM